MTKRWLEILFVAGLVAATGCTTESDCMSKYNLMKKDKEECKKTFPTLTEVVSPTPGPIIIIRKVAGDTLEWTVDGTVQPTGSSSAWSSGKIRSDFVGNSIIDFSVHAVSGTNYTNVSYVIYTTQVGSDRYTIEMFRVAGDKVRWYMSKNGMNRKVLVSDTGVSKSEVPLEFTAPLVTTPYSFREELEDTDIDQVTQFRVGL